MMVSPQFSAHSPTSRFAIEFKSLPPRGYLRGSCGSFSELSFLEPVQSALSTKRLLLDQSNFTYSNGPSQYNSPNGPDTFIILVPCVFAVLFALVFIAVITVACWNCCVRCKDLWIVDRAQVQSPPQQAHTPDVSLDVETAGPLHHHSLNREGCKKPQRQEIERMLVTKHYHPEQDQQLEGSLEQELPECAICLNSFVQGEEVAQSVNPDCQHLFHTECIVEWLTNNPGCPACRRPFLVEPTEHPTDTSDDEEPRYMEPQCVFP